MPQTIHHYHPGHGAYLGESIAATSPLEPDHYLLPDCATTLTPPAVDANQIPVFRNGGWVVMPDWRGAELFATTDGSTVSIDTPGVIPDDISATHIPRPDPGHAWRDDAWVVDPQLTAAWLAGERAARLAAINAGCDVALAALTATYPEREISSWPQQEREARVLAATPTAVTPLLAAISAARGMDVATLAARVREKSDAFAIASGAIIGRRQALEDALAAIDLDG